MSSLIVLTIVIVGFILPLRLSWRSKSIMVVVVLLALSKSYLHYIVGGNTYDPQIPYNLFFVLDIARSCMMFLALLVLVRFVINCLYRLIKLSWHVSLLPTFSLFHAQLMLLVSFACACYGTSCAYGMPELKPYEFTIENLDPRLDGMRLVVMSDIHVSSPTDVNLIYKMVREVNALEPDLILLPGDLIDGSVESRRPITNLLFELKAKYGTFISTGNHEYYSGYEQWREYFEKGGLISLDNKVVELLDHDGKPLLNLGGITDPRAARYNLPTPDIKGVVDALDPRAPSIILSHRPQYAPELAASKKVDLVLSGHTHGGLVIGFDRIVANANAGFVSGLYELGKTKLVVGNGTMIWMGMPLRLGVPSQILLITLRSAERPSADTLMLTRAADLRRAAAAKAAAAEAAALEAQSAESAAQQEADTMSTDDSDAAITTTASTSTASSTSTSPESTAVSEKSASSSGDTTSSTKEVPAHGEALGELGSQPEVKNAVQGLQLIMPMKNAEDGSISASVTNMALLPGSLSADQLSRINDILNEDPEEIARAKAKAEAEAKRAAALKMQALSSQVNMIVLKDSTTNESNPAPAQTKDEIEGAAATANTTSTTTTTNSSSSSSASAPAAQGTAGSSSSENRAGILHLRPQSTESKESAAPTATPAPDSAAEGSATENTASRDEGDGTETVEASEQEIPLEMAPNTPVVQLGTDDTNTTFELQAEYALSLSNAAMQLDDQSVQELIPADKNNSARANDSARTSK